MLLPLADCLFTFTFLISIGATHASTDLQRVAAKKLSFSF